MQSERNIQAFLESAKMQVVQEETKVSRFTLLKMKKGDFNVQFRSVKAVSDYIDRIFEKA